ncbi:MAG: hypothetical protein WC565_01040 [Parcubacteria group bacterium]
MPEVFCTKIQGSLIALLLATVLRVCTDVPTASEPEIPTALLPPIKTPSVLERVLLFVTPNPYPVMVQESDLVLVDAQFNVNGVFSSTFVDVRFRSLLRYKLTVIGAGQTVPAKVDAGVHVPSSGLIPSSDAPVYFCACAATHAFPSFTQHFLYESPTLQLQYPDLNVVPLPGHVF